MIQYTLKKVYCLRKYIFIVFFTLILFNGCGGGSSSSTNTENDNNTLVKITPTCFQAYSNEPILKSGDLFANSTWNDPSILYVNNQYVMYASSDINFNGDIKVYRLTSSDGITWSLNPTSAVLEKGTSGAWDDKATETPNVVFYNNQYHMFYTGYQTNTVTGYKIGHAVSNDGITWTKDASNPIITPTGTPTEFDGSAVAEPGAVVYNNKIYLYFSAIGYNAGVSATLQVIGLKTFDGTNWSSTQSVLEPDQSIYPRGDDVSGYYGYSTPSAIEYNNKIHLFFDVAKYVDSNWTQVKLHHASSSDGINNFTTDYTAIHSREEFDWTEKEIRSITPSYINNNFRIYYAGHKNLTLGIGFSTCK
jgi:predicted GH43/DUF377 family glycosyl hydrolase